MPRFQVDIATNWAEAMSATRRYIQQVKADMASLGVPAGVRSPALSQTARREEAQLVRAAQLGLDPLAGGRGARDARIAAAQQAQTAALRRGAAEVELGLSGRGGPVARDAAIAEARRVRAIQAAALAAEGTTQLEVASRARRTLADNARNHAVNAAAQQAQREADVGRGTLYQRVQAYASRRAGGAPIPVEDRITAGQAFTSKALISGQFALAGAAIYGGVKGVTAMITEAEKLQLIFSQIRDQFATLGDQKEFAGFRSSILGIARDMGVAAQDVALIGFQMKGAFGDTKRAVEETAGAFRVSIVTGLPLAELTDSLTASAKTYGVSIEAIGDAALGVQDRFGVLAKETLKVFGDLAPAAKEAGLNLKEVGALVGTIQQVSGQSGGTIANSLGRVLPSIGTNAAGIIRLYKSVPSLAPNLAKVTEGLRTGQTGQVFLQLIRDYGSLDKAQQQFIVRLLGGRREAATLDAAFGNSGKIIGELDSKQSDAGKTARRFNDIQHTLAQTIRRVREELRQLGDDLARAGLFDAFALIAGATEKLVQFLGLLARTFADVNQASGGVAGRLLAIAVAIEGIRLAIYGVAKLRAGLALGQGVVALVERAAAGGVGTAAIAPSAVGGGAAALGEGALGAGLLARAGSGAGGYLSRIGALGAGAGAGAVAGAATLGVAFAATYAVQEAHHQYNRLQKDQRDAAKIYKGAFAGLSLGELQRQIRGGQFGRARSGLFDQGGLSFEGVGANLTGHATAYEQAQKALEERTVSEYDQAVATGALPSGAKIRDALAKSKGRGASGAAARKLLAGLSKDQQAKIRQVVATQAGNVDDQLKTLEETQAQFDAGQISFDTLATALRSELDIQRSADNGTDPARTRAVLDLAKRYRKALADTIGQQAATVASLSQLAGKGPGAELPGLLEGLQRQLANKYILNPTPGPGGVTGLPDVVINRDYSPADAAATAKQYADVQKTAAEYAAAHAKSPAEEQRIISGLRLPPLVVTAITDEQVLLYGHIIYDPVIAFTEEQQKKAQQDAVNLAVAQHTAALGASISDPAAAAKNALDAARRNLGLARNEPDSPTKPADIANALVAVTQAYQGVADTAAAIAAARLNLLAAQAQGDPVAEAKIQKKKADLAAQTAKGAAALIDAQALEIEADRAGKDAVLAVFNAQADLLIAMAAAAGDIVGAAREGLAKAQAALDEARAKGLGDTALKPFQAAVVAAAANARDVLLQDAESTIDFRLQMRQITIAQAVAELQRQLDENRAVALTRQERQELQLKILGLKQQGAANLAFDTPSEIKTPTLYEVRRFQSATNAGPTYNDNRVVDARFVINNGMDLAAAKAWLSDAVNDGSKVYGAAPRRV